MTQLPKSIVDLINLENFRNKIEMYIGEKKISVLKAFIDGYYFAVESNGILISEENQLDKFYDWTAEYFGWGESTIGWKNIILEECNGDEEKSVDKFFELYDTFIRSNQ